jgi:Uma2 family endonuclease
MSVAYAIREPEAKATILLPTVTMSDTTMPLRFKKDRYTFADYLAWGDVDFWAEIIYGEIYMINTPVTAHQRICFELSRQIGNFLKGKPDIAEAFFAPYAVRLFPKSDNSDDIVLQPDIVVVCDPAKVGDYSCNGAPDLAVEILSPSTASHDRIFKRHQYLKAGVREYWIIDPVYKMIEVNILDATLGNNQYIATTYDHTETLPVSVLPGCEIDLSAVFWKGNKEK